jgi:RNA polymerase sigma-70 factor, ECF subfamily
MSRSPLRGTDPGDRSDAVLELRFPETFETFYRRELPSLVAFAGALSGSTHADDIAQEAMLAAYRHWDEVSRLDAPAAWVRRVCANRAVSTLRRRAVEAMALIRLGSRRPDPEPLPAQHEALWAEVRELPRRQAQVIALHYIFDLDVVGIATTLGCAEGTVKVHLSRGRAALALRMDPTWEKKS